MQANKGEWSELYALLAIFANNKVPAADKDLNPTGDEYIFLQVLRDDTGQRLIYDLERDGVVVICEKIGQALKTVSTKDLPEKTKALFQKIKAGSDNATFSIPEAVTLMDEFELEKIKANSGEKSDIVAIVKDKIASQQELGFSVKSQAGNPSTLLNASRQTNFTYRVNNYSGSIEDVNIIEGRSKIRDRLNFILNGGGSLDFVGINSQTFSRNLMMIDTVLPRILSEMLLQFYLGNGPSVKTLSEIDGIGGEYGLDKKSVSFKIKNMLRAIALGMVPSKDWDTYLSTYGGYIIVKNDGALVCYHLYNDDQFKDYLFENTRFDTPSSSRHDFGKLYERDGKLYFDLNIQIRFIK